MRQQKQWNKESEQRADSLQRSVDQISESLGRVAEQLADAAGRQSAENPALVAATEAATAAAAAATAAATTATAAAEAAAGAVTEAKAEAAEAEASQAQPGRGARVLKWLPAAAALATVGTLIVMGIQTKSISDQADATQQTLRNQMVLQEAESRQADLEFLSRLTPAITERGIELENSSTMPIQQLAFWYLTIHPEIGDERDVIHEVEGEVGGVPSCSITTVTWEHLSESRESSPEENKPPATFQRGQREELHFVLQAPSGRWYMLGESGTLLSVEYDAADASSGDQITLHKQEFGSENGSDVPATLNPMTYPYDSAGRVLEALASADLYSLAADTYWGGASGVDMFTAQSLFSIGNDVTGNAQSSIVERKQCG